MTDAPHRSPPPRRKHARWLRREGIDLGDAIVQFFSVLLGVLLALLISQWTNHRQQEAKARATLRGQQAMANAAMRAIHAELTANRAALHRSTISLTAEAAAMQTALGNTKQPPRWCFQWHGWAGTNTPSLVDAAYQTAVATQALSYMPFKQAQRVAQVYGHQHLKQQDFDVIANKILIAGPQPVNVCITGILGMVQDEHVLDAQYDPLLGPDKVALPQPPAPPTAARSSISSSTRNPP